MPLEGSPRRRPPLPVAAIGLDTGPATLERLAKGWLLALVDDAPLAAIAALPAAELARDAPRLCAAVVEALGSDEALARLEPGGALAALAARSGAMVGAGEAAGTATALEALRAVLWAVVVSAVPHDGGQVAALADRLGHVSAVLTRTALEAAASANPRGAEEGGDEDHGLATALTRRIDAARSAGTGLAVLLVELDDADRIVLSEAAEDAAAAFGHVGRAVSDAVRRPDVIACEEDGRTWVVAGDTDRAGAAALAGRIAREVEHQTSVRGAPLVVSIGLALLGEDGDEAEALLATAEEAAYGARAAGVRVSLGAERSKLPAREARGPRLVV